MNIFIAPVSGGAFVSQLAIMQLLGISDIKPNIFLCSSGGNLASYIAAGSNMDWNMIEVNSSKLSNKIFVKPWSMLSITSLITGYFQGNLYNRGDGDTDFLKSCFTFETIKDYEIWTGVYNVDVQKAKIFCNKSKEDSQLDISCIDTNLVQCLPFEYCNYEFDLISKVCSASAGIPAYVPPQIIDNARYIDGGISSASPLTSMVDSILQLSENNSLHMYYINSVDLNKFQYYKVFNLIDNWRQATYNMVKSQTLSDRMFAIQILRLIALRHNKVINYEEGKLDLDKIKSLQQHQYTLVELYPENYTEVEISNFNGDDVVKCIREARENINCRMWYI